jgi:hypothetical protein
VNIRAAGLEPGLLGLQSVDPRHRSAPLVDVCGDDHGDDDGEHSDLQGTQIGDDAEDKTLDERRREDLRLLVFPGFPCEKRPEGTIGNESSGHAR